MSLCFTLRKAAPRKHVSTNRHLSGVDFGRYLPFQKIYTDTRLLPRSFPPDQQHIRGNHANWNTRPIPASRHDRCEADTLSLSITCTTITKEHSSPSPATPHPIIYPPVPHTPLAESLRTMESRSTSPRGRKRDRLGNEISSSAAGALSPSPRSGANTPSASATSRRPPAEEEEPRYVGDPSYLEVSGLCGCATIFAFD